jgi:hypothetical protein
LDLVELFSKAPASFVWSTNDAGRQIGTAEGMVIDLWQGSVDAAALFPPDRLDLAARNGVLFQLLLCALRPDWQSASSWLAQQLRRAARTAKPFEEVNVTRRVRFLWDRTHSRATLKVLR